MGAQRVVGAIAAGVTALIVGTLIATVSDAAHAADVAKAASIPSAATATVAADTQTTATLAAYRASLQDATAKLDAAYAELRDRDQAYRAVVTTSDQNAAALQTANQALTAKIVAAYAEVKRLSTYIAQAQAQAKAQSATGRAATVESREPENEAESGDD